MENLYEKQKCQQFFHFSSYSCRMLLISFLLVVSDFTHRFVFFGDCACLYMSTSSDSVVEYLEDCFSCNLKIGWFVRRYLLWWRGWWREILVKITTSLIFSVIFPSVSSKARRVCGSSGFFGTITLPFQFRNFVSGFGLPLFGSWKGRNFETLFVD